MKTAALIPNLKSVPTLGGTDLKYDAFFSSMSGRLTKKLFLSAPAGIYLASNVGFPPIFAEVTASSMPARLAQWKRIVEVGANGRLCYLYDSKGAYDRKRAALVALMLQTKNRPSVL
jgi:hypothetical protein